MSDVFAKGVCIRDEHMLSNLSFYRANIADSKQAVYDTDNCIGYTYGDLYKRANRLAAYLSRELGLEKGDRVGLCSPNSVAFIDAFYASCKTGFIITTYNFLLNSKELAAMVAREEPKVLFYSSKYADTIDALRPLNSGMAFIPLDTPTRPGDSCCYADIMSYKAQGDVSRTDLEMEDIQMLLHTGGTTGVPKAAMISYRSLFYNSLSEVLTFGLSSRDTAYVFLPFFHTAAWNVLTLPLLLAGGRILISKGFDAGRALEIISSERPTVAMAVETIYKGMADHPRFAETDLSCYRWMLSGAAPISLNTLESYWSRGVKLVNAYGMTEIGPSNLAPPVDDIDLPLMREKWNSVGKPMYFNNVRIVDENGNDVAEGQLGELIWKGYLSFSGYWRDESGTKEAIRDGWIYSGDIGYRTADGFYYICGRRKNMFISGGENIFPLEIETVLQTHPQVESACVIGVPDEKWGEVGKALVVPKGGQGLTRQDIAEHLEREISRIKMPRYITIVDTIPRNALGKNDMAEIFAQYGHPEE